MALRCLNRLKINFRTLQPLRTAVNRNSSILCNQFQLFKVCGVETLNLTSIRLRYDKSGSSSVKDDEDVSLTN
jgi:hypothetical protein